MFEKTSKVEKSKFWSPKPRQKQAKKIGGSLVCLAMEKIDSLGLISPEVNPK